jgi:hypothetical protein
MVTAAFHTSSKANASSDACDEDSNGCRVSTATMALGKKGDVERR